MVYVGISEVRGRVRVLNCSRGGGNCVGDAERLRIVDVIVMFASSLWCSAKCTVKSWCRVNVSLHSDPVISIINVPKY